MHLIRGLAPAAEAARARRLGPPARHSNRLTVRLTQLVTVSDTSQQQTDSPFDTVSDSQ